MRMRFNKGRKKAGGRLSKSPLVEKLKAGAAVLAISVAGCTMDTGGLAVSDSSTDAPIVDGHGGSDSRPDNRVPDKGSDHAVPDMGVDKSVPDTGVDTAVPDTGVDIGPDTGVDLGPDSGSVCPGVVNDTAYGKAAYVGTPVTVGGYSIENTGAVPGGVNVDVACGSNSSAIKNGVFLPKGGAEVVVNVPADGKKIRLKNITNDSWVSNLNVVVETL